LWRTVQTPSRYFDALEGWQYVAESHTVADDQAISALYERYSSVVYSTALRVLNDPALAEQILSDIFLEIWRRPKRYLQITGSLSLWMVIVARNRAVAMLLHEPVSKSDFDSPFGVANLPEWNMTREEVLGRLIGCRRSVESCWRAPSSME
jgi:DNA-directed RNA polymerase specialized sigma24 family protein